MRIIQFFLATALASLGCIGTQPLAQGVKIDPYLSGRWEGTWMTEGSSIENNVYHMLSITEANMGSFTYVLDDRPVPYGPNAIWSEGTAQFRNEFEAIDVQARRTFILRVDPGDRQQRVIEIDGEAFLFVDPGIEDDHGDSRQTATPIGSNSNTSGHLTSGDVDYFRVDFSEGADPWIWTSGGVETLGVVEASSGFIVAGGPDWNWWDFDPTVTVNFPMNHVNFGPNEYIDEGTYFIRVAGYADYSTGSYTLHVRPTPVRPTLMRPTPVRPAERLLGIYFGGWYAEHVNEDGELEQWEIVFDERSVAVSGTFNMVVRNSAEDRTQIARSEQTRVTGDYNHPVVVLYGTNTIASDPEETAECMFGGVMESNGNAIIGGLVCEADGERVDRQLRFLRN